MYRIIGITSDGRIKIQKNNSIGTAQWYTSYQSDIKWPDSDIYTKTLKNFYSNTQYVTAEMKEKIEEHTWNTGDVGVGKYSNGTTVYNAEYGTEETTHSHQGYYGLAYFSDYYFAYNEEGTQQCNSNPYCKSWMIPSNYQTLWSNTNVEWTMSRFGYSNGYCILWLVDHNGIAGSVNLGTSYATRPVFYLKSNVKITDGTGTSDAPFIVSFD